MARFPDRAITDVADSAKSNFFGERCLKHIGTEGNALMIFDRIGRCTFTNSLRGPVQFTLVSFCFNKCQARLAREEEVSLFLETCNQKRPEYYLLFLIAFRTGMRLGELLGLKLGDVDWNGKFIRVSRSAKRGKITPTKPGKARRVDMPDQLIDVLKALQTQRKREALMKGHGGADGFIFLSRANEILSQNTVRNVFKGILHKAGLRDIRLHETRHTFASLLLTDGQCPVYVKEQLGYSSIQRTVAIYGHLITSSNRAVVNRLDETQPSATSQNTKAATH